MATAAFADPPPTSDFTLDESTSVLPKYTRNSTNKYEDIKKCVSDTSTLISSVKAVVPSDPRGTRRPSLNTDTPVHTPYRIATDRTLKASRLKRLEPILGEHARREFQKVVDRGHSNVSTEFGAIFAAWVEVTWLNNEEDSTPVLAKTAAAWANAWRE